jgi:hypothetical protein
MKLGTQTASISNHIYSRAVIGQPEPEVGMGATILCWTDRHAATIVEVFASGRDLYIVVQEDNCTRKDKNGMSESQEWDCSPDPRMMKHTFRRGWNEQDGRWQKVWFNKKTTRWNKVEGEGLLIGQRKHYHDFSF